MHRISFLFGAFLYFLGFVAFERKKGRDMEIRRLEAERQTKDAELRQARLEAGGDVKNDKTILGRFDKDDK